VLRVTVPTKAMEEVVENFSMQFFKGETVKSASLRIAWDKVLVEVPIEL
jgi:hypothetical protein